LPESLPKRSLGGKLREEGFPRLLPAGDRGRRARARGGAFREDGLEAREALAQASGHVGIAIAGRRLVLAGALADGEVVRAGSFRVQSLMAGFLRSAGRVIVSDAGRQEIPARLFARSPVLMGRSFGVVWSPKAAAISSSRCSSRSG
jgi:hypothetical protein